MQYWYNTCQRHEPTVTFLTVVALIASVADAGTHDADAVSSTVDVDALVGWYVALCALPPTVALTATTRVLTITTAQHWTGGCNTHTGRQSCQTQCQQTAQFLFSLSSHQLHHNKQSTLLNHENLLYFHGCFRYPSCFCFCILLYFTIQLSVTLNSFTCWQYIIPYITDGCTVIVVL